MSAEILILNKLKPVEIGRININGAMTINVQLIAERYGVFSNNPWNAIIFQILNAVTNNNIQFKLKKYKKLL